MADAALRQMTADEFLDWSQHQEERYEFIDGRPVLKFPPERPGMMAGATEGHDQIVVNLIALLRNGLRGGPCRAKSADQASRMARGNIRLPDVTIDCGPRQPKSLETAAPTVFFEVLSPSTRRLDLLRKVDEYQRVPTLRHFVLLEPDQARALLWSRDEDGGWASEPVEGLDAALTLPAVSLILPMSEIYEDVEADLA